MTTPDINTAIDIIAKFFPVAWTVKKSWGQLSAESPSGAAWIMVVLDGPTAHLVLNAQLTMGNFQRAHLTRAAIDDFRVHRLELDQAARVMLLMADRFEKWSWTKEDLMKEEP